MLPSASMPMSVATADFNGDKNVDFAVADFGTNNVMTFFGNGMGGFNPGQTINTGVGTSPEAVLSADFNGDGLPDLAIANSATNTVSVVLNMGGGTGMFGTVSAANTFSVGTGLRALAASANVANLLELDLQENTVGPRGAGSLAASPYLGSHTTMWLSQSAEGQDVLRQRFGERVRFR